MNEEIMTPGTTGMIVNSGMKADLISASKWALFLCIIHFAGNRDKAPYRFFQIKD